MANKLSRKLILLLLVPSLVLSISACATLGVGPEEALEPDKGQFTLYFNGPDKTYLDVTFELKTVSIMSEDGVYRDVIFAPVEINSTSIKGGQLLLGEMDLPTGKYTRLKILLGEAKIQTEKGTASLALEPETLEIPVNVSIERDENTALFLVWDADASVKDGYLFSAELDPQGEKADLAPLLLFVSNEKSGNISVINRELDKVVAVIKTGKQPRGIAAGFGGNLFRVYAANYGSNSISVIDPVANRVENEIFVRFGKGSQDLAVAELENESEFLFVVNFDSNNVSVIDPLSGMEVERVNVGDGPVAIGADPPLAEFENSQFLDPADIRTIRGFRESFLNVYVANSRSRDVSVLKVDVLTGEVAGVMDVQVEWNPTALSFDPQRARVYVPGYDSEKVSVIDIVKIINGDTTAVSIGDFGFANIDVLPDPSLNRLYLLRHIPGEITIVNAPRELDDRGFELLPFIEMIPVEEAPRAILLDQEGRKIYVVNQGSDSVSVIDKITRKVEKRIPVGKNPYDITGFASF